ncbi:MAG: bifunctional 4-hydroxy-2-oxoglutarate aldolase/2-dehydro-3-deoxy-phosphogluconate aldolase [Ruminococcaceae bacterium]|nr:bifunctional 4-hydroxy-2-oxoglutarate aldolase/2-dehydro-3-deoxy-phosphogluconate aldolase [Oscillospiraceae bacterium]
MRTKEEVLMAIKESGMVAVVRGETSEKAMEIVEKCIDGGIKAIELTFTVPYAHRVIEDISRKYGEEIILGAGTVLDSETARIALLSGAEFIVSPHFNPEVTRVCNRYRKASMAGILTITEAVEAMEAGVDVLKLFPGDLFGPAFIKDIRGPLPYVQIMPTGGVTAENAGDWIRAGAVAVGAGSSLMKGDVKANAALFVKNIREAREGK